MSTHGWRIAAPLLVLALLAAAPALGQARAESCELFLHTLPNAGASLENTGSGATALVGVTVGQASPAGVMRGSTSGQRAELGFWGTTEVLSVPEPSHRALGLAALVAMAAIGGSARRRRFASPSRSEGMSGRWERRQRAGRST
jgi:hypothetical protein